MLFFPNWGIGLFPATAAPAIYGSAVRASSDAGTAHAQWTGVDRLRFANPVAAEARFQDLSLIHI